MDSSQQEQFNGDQLSEEQQQRVRALMERLNEAMAEVMAQMSTELDRRIREITTSDLSEESKQAKLKELGEEIKQRALESLSEQERSDDSNQSSSSSDEAKQKKDKAVKSVVEMAVAAKKGIKVSEDPKVQQLLKDLGGQRLTETDLQQVTDKIGDFLIGKKPILFSSSGQQKTAFEQALESIYSESPTTGKKIYNTILENAPYFGQTREDLAARFSETFKNSDTEYKRDDNFNTAMDKVFGALSREQRELFLRYTGSTESFLEVVNEKIRKIKSDEASIRAKKEEIKELYENKLHRHLTEDELNRLTERALMIKVSEEITAEMNDFYIEIYRRIFNEAATKAFEEIEREDIMHGIDTVKNHIIRSFQRLETELMEMEQMGDERLVKLYLPKEQEVSLNEFNIDGTVRQVPRIRPIPYLEEARLSEFAKHLLMEFNHWREFTAYSHNTNLTYGHPAHEGSFYKALAKYAEHVKGGDIDSFMLLPDAPLVMEAYQLYEKLVEQQYSAMDWRIQATMFMNELSDTRTAIERQIMDYLLIKYQGLLPPVRLDNAVKKAVGIARGILLTEPEKTAFADPVDAKGTGFFASYGTNDSSSITAFNPLHVILRWQGEPNFNQVFFMPVRGKGRFFGDWDHREMIRNIEIYKKSFLNLKAGVEGTKDLKEREALIRGDNGKLMIDYFLGVTKTGGIFKRGGWRDFYAFESHYVYADQGKIDLIRTFKAMDVIGYEAVKYFLENLDGTFYNNYKPLSLAEKDALFKVVYDRYFYPLNKIDYQTYKMTLKTKAKSLLRSETGYDPTEEEVNKKIQELFVKGTLSRMIALKFPTKFLRIDKDRFHTDNQSRWKKVYEKMKKNNPNLDFNEFNKLMKDINFIEMLLRSENSSLVMEAIQMSSLPDAIVYLGDYHDLTSVLTEERFQELLKKYKLNEHRSEAEIKKLLELYKIIRSDYLNDSFLDGEAMKAMEKFPFTFGAEDIDLRLIAFRGTGPRMIARSIGDTASMEEKVVNGLFELPKKLHEMAINGKKDLTPVIQYLMQAKSAFEGVHGLEDSYYEFAYRVAGMVTNYFKKDTRAKLFGGILGWGNINSIAAEYAGRSTAVWEWDSIDIDRFAVALETYGILPKLPYNKSIGPRYETRYISFLGKKIPFGKKLVKDYKWTIDEWRKEFGADFKAKAFDVVNRILPLVIIFLLWYYFKKAYEEAQGKKK